MKPVHAQLPKGARVYLLDEAARKRHVETRLFDVFRHWGAAEKSLRALRHAQSTAGQDDARPRRGPPLGLAESVEVLISSPASRTSVIGVFRDAAAVSAPVSRSGGRSRPGG